MILETVRAVTYSTCLHIHFKHPRLFRLLPNLLLFLALLIFKSASDLCTFLISILFFILYLFWQKIKRKQVLDFFGQKRYSQPKRTKLKYTWFLLSYFCLTFGLNLWGSSFLTFLPLYYYSYYSFSYSSFFFSFYHKQESLDREYISKYHLKIGVSDSVHFTTGQLDIVVTDINDNPPRFNQTYYSFDILENTERGVVVSSICKPNMIFYISLNWSFAFHSCFFISKTILSTSSLF